MHSRLELTLFYWTHTICCWCNEILWSKFVYPKMSVSIDIKAQFFAKNDVANFQNRNVKSFLPLIKSKMEKASAPKLEPQLNHRRTNGLYHLKALWNISIHLICIKLDEFLKGSTELALSYKHAHARNVFFFYCYYDFIKA